ncbi:metallopeptidase M50 family protein [Synechococcus sp. PROS-7-1]|uniref:site-2 protease family protein n=1 Tax=Synechococcus sp. PROS-7-1 TaxID=1442556 RepID=UPI001646392C|nr:site-2 protease family protein [Synechococcus sp. PROS-7-1]QNI84587.1 metallopeptidase M50 family protein [Synechococcus sp. PROS-7-1]
MGDGWQLMRIGGIPLRVHPSWFIILVLFTLAFQSEVAQLPEAQGLVWASWLTGFLTALLLFVSVLLHELGHSVMAIREGVKVSSITLFLLGGVARVEKECPTPMGALRVAAAGPAVSLLLAAALLASMQAAVQVNPLLGNLVAKLGWLNLILALFNLLPGLPLDGGLILKALVWQWTGSQRRGIQVATASGRFLSLLAMVIGFWLIFKGAVWPGLWLVMLGWFGMGASRSQTQTLALQQVLQNETVGKTASRRFRVVEADQPLRTLSQMRLGAVESDDPRLSDWVLVCRNGRWVGFITDQPLRDLPVQQWDRQTISDHLQPLELLPSIQQSSPLWKAVLALEQSDQGRLLVLGPAGLPDGTLDRSELGEAVLRGLAVKLPDAMLESSRRNNTYPLGLPLLQVVNSMQASGLLKRQA